MPGDDERPSGRDDPRLDEAFVRRVHADDAGDVVLVGVVHDHPASEHRVRTVVREEAPDVLAVELAPLALPLFEQYAGTDASRPRGGEMSAAIDAADGAAVVAIDGPSLGLLRRLVGTIARDRPARSTVRTLCSQFATVTAHVLRCWLAAALGRVRSRVAAVHDAAEHDVTPSDPPVVQAEDERRQARRAVSVLSALSSPTHATYREALREEHMADRVTALRDRGDVVAVVGYGHLDAVAERLASA